MKPVKGSGEQDEAEEGEFVVTSDDPRRVYKHTPSLNPNTMTSNKLQILIDHAVKNIPFFRSHCTGSATLATLPITSKEIISANYSSFLSDDAPVEKAACIAFLSDESRCNELRRTRETKVCPYVLAQSTSGSTGKSFVVFKTATERINISLDIWRHRKILDPKVSRGNLMQLAHIISAQGNFLPDPQDYNPANIDKLYNLLIEHKPRWLHTRPSVIQRHLKVLSSSGKPSRLHGLRVIESTSEYLSKDVAEELGIFFGCRVVNQFGCIETSAFAYSDDDNKFTLIDDRIVEIVDSNGHIITEPCRPGRLLVTTFRQHFMPFIRYETGDIGEWLPTDGSRNPQQRRFKLHPYRERGMICVEGKWWVGAVFFENLIKRVCQDADCDKPEFIQIYQLAPTHLEMMISHFHDLEKFFSKFVELCNSANREVVVTKRVVSGSELRLLQFGKPMLFSRRF